jgi:hypothetical protein
MLFLIEKNKKRKGLSRNKQKKILIGYRNFSIRLDQTSFVHQKAKKKQQPKHKLIIPHPPSFNDAFILNF